MFLTKDEERVLDGDFGEAAATAMRLLVSIGEVFEAEKLIPVSSCHVSGVSYKNLGEAGLKLIEDLVEKEAVARVRSTLNPCGMDLRRWREMGVSENFAQRQSALIDLFRKMGIVDTLTCTPYLIGYAPKRGEHIAWGESSAVVFSNSVFGAKTNREAGITALASAIVGKTPLYGAHLEENRTPTHLVRVEGLERKPLHFSCLGYLVGKLAPDARPLFDGIRSGDTSCLKALSAGLATSGGIYIFHSRKWYLGDTKGLERIEITPRELKEVLEEFSSVEEPDAVLMGCPHLSLEELQQVANVLKGRKVAKKLWLFTSRAVLEEAERKGVAQLIAKSGAKIFCDTCMVVSPVEEMGIRSVLTNSCKAAHYLRSLAKVEVSLADAFRCVEVSLGEW